MDRIRLLDSVWESVQDLGDKGTLLIRLDLIDTVLHCVTLQLGDATLAETVERVRRENSLDYSIAGCICEEES